MSECTVYEGLRYVCPANGGWGMVRIAMMIPESVQLFIAPAACGRHGALGAIRHGIKDRLSYYYVDEKDIIEGYDSAVIEAAAVLLERLTRQGRRPKVMTLFFACIDDLIGTDTAALCEELENTWPDVFFLACRMNPITDDSALPPMVSVFKNIYSLLGRRHTIPEGTGPLLSDPQSRDHGLNCIGNLELPDPRCELFEALRLLGAGPLRHIREFQTFEGFLSMEKKHGEPGLFRSSTGGCKGSGKAAFAALAFLSLFPGSDADPKPV